MLKKGDTLKMLQGCIEYEVQVTGEVFSRVTEDGNAAVHVYPEIEYAVKVVSVRDIMREESMKGVL